MNIIRMAGGLGNQMFQYALYLKFNKMGIETKFDDFSEYVGRDNERPINLQVFGIDYPKCTMQEFYEVKDSYPDIFHKMKRKISGRKNRTYEEASANFDPKVLECKDNYVAGCFQSDKYFKDIKSTVISTFTFREDIKEKAEEILNASLKKNNLVVSDDDPVLYTSVHIRRGDYLVFSENYGGICTEEYYEKAVEFVLSKDKDTVFLVFSNDPEWTIEWVKKYTSRGIRMLVIEGTSEDTGYLDMCLMSQCRNNIVANSSFSWWGAYLNQNEGKIVVAPSKWANNIDQKDIYTDDMIKI